MILIGGLFSVLDSSCQYNCTAGVHKKDIAQPFISFSDAQPHLNPCLTLFNTLLASFVNAWFQV